MPDDEKLIRKIQKHGDRAAADALIRKHYEAIYAYIYRQTSNKETAMDITQDSFVSVLQTITRFDAKKAGFRTWLYRIATNKTVDYYRRRAVQHIRTIPLEDYDICDEAEFTKLIEEKELIGRVQACVNDMDADNQQVFRLKFYGEYTFAQIAEWMGVPESTVKSKYYRLLQVLKKELGDEYRD